MVRVKLSSLNLEFKDLHSVWSREQEGSQNSQCLIKVLLNSPLIIKEFLKEMTFHLVDKLFIGLLSPRLLKLWTGRSDFLFLTKVGY